MARRAGVARERLSCEAGSSAGAASSLARSVGSSPDLSGLHRSSTLSTFHCVTPVRRSYAAGWRASSSSTHAAAAPAHVVLESGDILVRTCASGAPTMTASYGARLARIAQSCRRVSGRGADRLRRDDAARDRKSHVALERPPYERRHPRGARVEHEDGAFCRLDVDRQRRRNRRHPFSARDDAQRRGSDASRGEEQRGVESPCRYSPRRRVMSSRSRSPERSDNSTRRPREPVACK